MIDLITFWERNVRRSITDRAKRIQNEADHERWTKESKDWMTHVVEVEARRLKMDDEARKTLADACVRGFNEINAEVCQRIYGLTAVS